MAGHHQVPEGANTVHTEFQTPGLQTFRRINICCLGLYLQDDCQVKKAKDRTGSTWATLCGEWGCARVLGLAQDGMSSGNWRRLSAPGRGMPAREEVGPGFPLQRTAWVLFAFLLVVMLI